MKAQWSTHSRYPAQRAFVVHVARPLPEDDQVPLGRAEHLVSGQSTHFTSWTELETFIAQVLAKTEEKPP